MAEVAIAAFVWHLRAASPSTRIETYANEAAKRRIGPFTDVGDEPVLDRIVMHVSDVPGIMGVITDPMRPKAALPQGDLSSVMLRRPIGSPEGDAGPLGDVAFQQAPTYCVIGILGWQGPNRMQVIGEQHHGLDAKGRVARTARCVDRSAAKTSARVKSARRR